MINERAQTVGISFNSKVDLSKISKEEFKNFEKVDFIKKNDEILAIILENKKTFFILTSEGVESHTSKKINLPKKTEKFVKEILLFFKKKENDFKVKDTSRDFSIDFSLKDKVIKKEFEDKINKIFLKKGYDEPQYVSLILMISKNKKAIGPVSLSYRNRKDYEINKLRISMLKNFEEEFKNLK